MIFHLNIIELLSLCINIHTTAGKNLDWNFGQSLIVTYQPLSVQSNWTHIVNFVSLNKICCFYTTMYVHMFSLLLVSTATSYLFFTNFYTSSVPIAIFFWNTNTWCKKTNQKVCYTWINIKQDNNVCASCRCIKTIKYN